MSRPKRHHYVTRAYLEGFLEANEKCLWVYGRHRRNQYTAKPESTAFQKNYYSFKKLDGTWDDTLEEFLANEIEGPGIELIRRLATRNLTLTWKERERLALLLAFQEFRVPFMRHFHDEMFRRILDSLQEDLGTKVESNLRLRAFLQFSQSISEITVTPDSIQSELQKIAEEPARFSRESMTHQAMDFMRIYRYMRWEIRYAIGGERFVTSDCPVMRVFANKGEKSISLLRTDVEIRFPLSGTTMLVLTHDQEVMAKVKAAGANSNAPFDEFERAPKIYDKEVTDASVSAANTITAKYCHFWLFSGREMPAAISLLTGQSENIKRDLEINENYLRVFGSL